MAKLRCLNGSGEFDRSDGRRWTSRRVWGDLTLRGERAVGGRPSQQTADQLRIKNALGPWGRARVVICTVARQSAAELGVIGVVVVWLPREAVVRAYRATEIREDPDGDQRTDEGLEQDAVDRNDRDNPIAPRSPARPTHGERGTQRARCWREGSGRSTGLQRANTALIRDPAKQLTIISVMELSLPTDRRIAEPGAELCSRWSSRGAIANRRGKPSVARPGRGRVWGVAPEGQAEWRGP